jgi:hypothetical protein
MDTDVAEVIERPRLTMTLLPDSLAICQLAKDAPIPDWASWGSLCSITRTPDELSIVCPQANVPAGLPCDGEWRALGTDGPLGFTLTGTVETLAEPLATAGISIFFISTYYTDYLMVKQRELHIAILALRQAGHTVVE